MAAANGRGGRAPNGELFALEDLEDLVGRLSVRLLVAGEHRVLARGLRQAKRLPSGGGVPVLDDAASVLALYGQISRVTGSHVLQVETARHSVMNVDVARHG